MADNVPELDDAFYFENADAWHSWLTDNHDKRDHAWLILYKKASGKANLSIKSAVMEAMCFGWIDGKLKSIDSERFILRYSPRKAKSPWSKINVDRAEILIRDGKMTGAGMIKIDEAKANGLWDAAYTSRVKPELPDDLKAALKTDSEAQKNFNNFANGQQFQYIFWLRSARTDITRQKRIAEVVRRAALNQKPGQ